MKNTLLVIVALLVGGCGKGDTTKEAPSKTKVTEDNNTKPIEVADTNATKLTAEEQKVVGEYELKLDGGTERVVLLENGIVDTYVDGKKEESEGKWKLTKGGELHTIFYGNVLIYRINKDGSITFVGYTRDGKRNDYSNFGQDLPNNGQDTVAEEDTFKKIK